jgi:allophanate hydrolase
MGKVRLKVGFAGPLVSFQDGGRFGMMRFGVPASGPMDRLAHAAANLALCRPAPSTAIEVSMGGLALECLSGEVSFCVAGGGFIVDHAGAKLGSWVVRVLRAGEKLVIRPGHWGSWAYLAFAGEPDCATWLGHSATHSISGFGGGKLTPGQEIVLRGAKVLPTREGDIPCPVIARPRHRVRVVPGPQEHHFRPEALAALFAEPFTLTPAYDRMGMRLAGPALELGDALSIPSEPVLRGSVQVAGDGAPTVLLADHQTTGGYPKIATVIAPDIDALVQLRPGDRLRFVPVLAEEAVAIARHEAGVRQTYLTALERPRGGLEERLLNENLISGAVDGGGPAAG